MGILGYDLLKDLWNFTVDIVRGLRYKGESECKGGKKEEGDLSMDKMTIKLVRMEQCGLYL